MKEPTGHLKNKLFRRFLAAFIFVLFLVIVLGVVREHFKRRELNKEIANLEAEVKNLETKKKDFLTSIELYQSDFFIEKEAREKFNLKKGGEAVSVIPVGANTKSLTATLSTEAAIDFVRPSLGENARGWWNYFFGARQT